MIFKMDRFGKSLGTRAVGKEVREQLRTALGRTSEIVILDFSGVEVITNSFADEVFGVLAATIGEDALKQRTTFRHINRLCAVSIRKAIDFRISLAS